MCEPIYRDIFLFKKNTKVSGIAKLCYDCEKSLFIGTSAVVSNFGAKGEFEQLRKIIK